MKKVQLLIISILLATSFVVHLFLPNSISYAAELSPDDLAKQDTYTPSDDNAGIDTGFVKRFGGDISSIGFGIAAIVSVIAVSFVGLKYITGGITEKADYKKDLIPMAVGIGIVVFLSTILSIIAKTAATI